MTLRETVLGDADTFNPLGATEEPVQEVLRERARSGYRVYRATDGLEVAVAESVIARAVALGRRAAPNEWYGILVGRLCADEGGRHVVVLGVVVDANAVASPGHVETTIDSEFQTRELARLMYPDAIVLGPIHGHVRCGVGYSTEDRENQAKWTQPHAVGIVVDPWDSAELTVYLGPRSEELSPVQALPADSAATAPAGPLEAVFTCSKASTATCSASSSPQSVRVRGSRSAPVLTALVCAVAVVALASLLSIFAVARRVTALESGRSVARLGLVCEFVAGAAADEDDSTP